MFTQQISTYRIYCQFVLAGSMAIIGSSCTLSPNDGDTVTSRTAAVSFSGYHPTANMTIQVQSFNPATGSFVALEPAATSASTPFRYDDTDLFPWSTSVTIPLGHWQAGRTGFVARLRTRDADGKNFYTFPPEWGGCLSDNPKIGDFLTRCTSLHSPELFLYTTDFPTSTDFVITSIRRGGRGILVRARNQGRHGKLTRIECSRFGGVISYTVNEVFRPAESREYDIGLTVFSGQSVTCTALAVNEDGTPESVTSNNSRTQTVF